MPPAKSPTLTQAELRLMEVLWERGPATVHQLLEEQATPYPVLLTLFRRTNGVIIVSVRSRNGEALKVAEKLQGGGHANASGATLPRSIKTIPDAVTYLREVLNPKKDAPLNSLEKIFAAIDMSQK